MGIPADGTHATTYTAEASHLGVMQNTSPASPKGMKNMNVLSKGRYDIVD